MNPRFCLYLASQSSRRREYLKSMKIPFRVVQSTYHERSFKVRKPSDLARRHAVGKARRAIVRPSARWILGADTIVVQGNMIFGKPKNREESLQMLEKLSGKKHTVMTAVSLFDRKKNKSVTRLVKTDVWIKKMSPGKRKKYLDLVYTLDKAGSYAIQSGPRIVEKIKGSYSNVVGLPCEMLAEMLEKFCGKRFKRLPSARSGVLMI